MTMSLKQNNADSTKTSNFSVINKIITSLKKYLGHNQTIIYDLNHTKSYKTKRTSRVATYTDKTTPCYPFVLATTSNSTNSKCS